jgi:GAF domain-containing protein/DNA-binding CsgD family transcriptional regulator
MAGTRGRAWDEVLLEVSRLLDDVHHSPDAILRVVATSLSTQVPGTWAAVLMDDDPTRSLVLVDDHSDPEVADYIRRFMAHHSRPERAPTSGLSRQVIDSGEALLIPRIKLEDVLALSSGAVRDYWGSHPPPAALMGESIWGVLWVPIRAYGSVLGTLALGERRPDCELAEVDKVGLQAIADLVGLALRNSQFENAAIRRNDRLSAVESIVTVMTAGADLRATFSVILEQLIERLAIDAADILTVDQALRVVQVAASRGFFSSYPSNGGGKLSTDIWSHADDADLVSNIADLDRLEHSWRRSLFAREGFKAYLGIPTIVRGTVVGVLEMFHRSEFEPDNESIAFMRVLATLAAIAIDGATAPKARPTSEVPAISPSRRPIPDLSRTERDVLPLIVDGQTNREIARRSYRSESTVKSCVRQLLRKARVRNRTELARVALSEGWL